MYQLEPSSTKGFYFYDFQLSNRDHDTHSLSAAAAANGLNSQSQLQSSNNYRSGSVGQNSNNFYHQREDYNNRLYDNVPRKPLVSQLRHTSSSAQFNEIPLRPIAEVKPFYIYSTTDQAVASAEQRLYDAVSTLSRRRAAMTASETQFAPMNSYRNNVVKPQQIINSSANVIRPKPIYSYQNNNIHRSISIGNEDAASFSQYNPYSPSQTSSNNNSPSSYTTCKRSYYPVYRHGGVTMISPPSTCNLSRRSSAMVDSNYGSSSSNRYQPAQQDTYFSPFLPPPSSRRSTKESIYRTPFMDDSFYEPTNQGGGERHYSPSSEYVRNKPMNQSPYYAVSNRAAAARNGFVEKRVNKSTTLENTYSNLDHEKYSMYLRNDAATTTVPTTNSKLKKNCPCRSCAANKGVDCSAASSGGQNILFDKEIIEGRRKSFNTSLLSFEGKASTPSHFEEYHNHHHSQCGVPILEQRKQRRAAAPPSYDALYSVSNISSSSSAYSSGSSPLDPSDLTISTTADMLSVPLNCKVNYAPPRPQAKPFTIAAVSPNHVSTISIPEVSSAYPPPRATSAIGFDNNHDSNNRELGRTRRYSTLRPSKPPPPPPHQNLVSQKPATPSPKLITKKNKREERAAMLRAQSKISLMENFFQTDKSSQPPPPAINRAPTTKHVITGITSVGAVSHVNNIKHLEEGNGKNLKNKIIKSKKKDKKPKIRKEDIGSPINFQHKAHIGWNQDGGFNQQVFDTEPMDDSVRDLLRAAGQDPDNLKPEDVKFVYSFIENWNAGQQDAPPRTPAQISNPAPAFSNKPTPPLPPAYNNSRMGGVPTTSDVRHNRPLPQLPPPTSHSTPMIPRHEQAPARPPPPPPPPINHKISGPPSIINNRTASLNVNQTSSAPPPPPPPPPPATMKNNGAPPPPPPPPPPPGPLLSTPSTSAASGAPSPPKSTGPPRANLLAEIQAGAKLKSVGAPPEKSPAGLGKIANGGSANPRDNMMNAIKQGATLKHVDQAEVAENRKSTVGVQDMDGIAGALARALESRRNKMLASDSEEERDNDSEWEDE